DFDARLGSELGEDVPNVRLDGLATEEQLLRDLAVGPAVDDATGDLEFPLSERVDPAGFGGAAPRAAMDVVAQLTQLALGRVAIALRADGVERKSGLLEKLFGAVGLPRRGE